MPGIRTTLLICAMGGASAGALADRLDLQALTCTVGPSTETRFKEFERLGRKVKEGVGGVVLDGRYTFGALCVERISITGGFGVMIVSGTVCDAKPEPFLEFVLSEYPELQRVEDVPPAPPGVIGTYGSPRRSFAMYKGRVGLPPSPDPNSKEVSYGCAYRVSGSQ